MYQPAKIATCCYCGTRAALTLKGRVRHELACSNCGAPLHEMKMLKAPEPTRPQRSHGGYSEGVDRRRKSKSRRKPKKSLKRRVLEELWDIAEDIFD